jgi:hypothetical protein
MLGMVHVGGPHGAICLEQSEDVTTYLQDFQHIQVAALNRDVSLESIQQLAEA